MLSERSEPIFSFSLGWARKVRLILLLSDPLSESDSKLFSVFYQTF